MQVVHVGSEVFPYSRSGGLGDVLGALPVQQARQGAEVTVVSPWYMDITEPVREVWRGHLGDLSWDVGEIRLGEARRDGVQYVFIGMEAFDRPGLYHPDDVWRFSMFGRVVLPALGILRVRPQMLHGHDWQAALVVARAKLARLPTVYTIHNLQYQGKWNMPEGRVWTALPDWAYGHEGLEFYGEVNLMKAGLVFASHVTTVSPTYAREITTFEYGERLDGLLTRLSLEGRLSGIINGLDQERWDPRTDPDIPRYADPLGKQAATAALRQEFDLDDAPILATVSRLADQKGMDLLIEALPELIQDWNVVVLGGGDPLLVAALQGWAQHRRVVFVQGMNEPLAHRIYAGASAFAMPSRFEPCGLSQMISMRYGTLPIVRETGGLVDTVPHDVGFRFTEATPQAFKAACDLALRTPEPEWQARAEKAMSLDFSWDGPTRQYLELYGSLSAVQEGS